MSPKVVVVDYGLGNVHSVVNALRQVGGDPRLSARPEEVAGADRVVLPGVGAFGDGMTALRARELDAALQRFVQSGRPLLGICLGMQLLLGRGEEFGVHAGLDLIAGRVPLIEPIPPAKVPHVGWNRLRPSHAERGWADFPLRVLSPGTAVYFVHSFAAAPADPGHRLAEVSYGGQQLCAAVGRDNVLGCQFHPEKSGAAGLALCKEFLEWRPL